MYFASRTRLLICAQTSDGVVTQHHTPRPGTSRIQGNTPGERPRVASRRGCSSGWGHRAARHGRSLTAHLGTQHLCRVTEGTSGLHTHLVFTSQQTPQREHCVAGSVPGRELCRLKPMLWTVFINNRKNRTKMNLIYFYHYFHTGSKTPAMFTSFKLTQLESCFVYLNCLQTRLKTISIGRLESLQRSILI